MALSLNELHKKGGARKLLYKMQWNKHEQLYIYIYTVYTCMYCHKEKAGLGFPDKILKMNIIALKRKYWKSGKHSIICAEHFMTGEKTLSF